MSIVVHCMYCGKKLNAPEKFSGKRIRCRQCAQERAAQDSNPASVSTVDGHPASRDTSLGDAQTIGAPREALSSKPVTVPGYEILAEIGRGGMGAVYKAKQKSLNRLVALKTVLTGNAASERQKQRFVIEAEAVAKLRHRGIVQVYDFGDANGLLYFTMEYVEGGTLSGKRPKNPKETAAIMMKLAEAVQYAHERGIIHRDLKPGNVLMTEDGNPMITDFGLAKRLLDVGGDVAVEDDKSRTSRAGLTMAGRTLGTPGYMSPEQARGDIESIGTSTDVYSLGAILYELLTGKTPFSARTLEDVLTKTIRDAPKPPSSLNERVPLDLDAICLKCLRKDPADRYDSAKDLSADLRRYITDMPVEARSITARERLTRWASRNRRTAVLVTSLLTISLIAVVLVQLVMSLGGQVQQAQEQTTVVENRAKQEEEKAKAFEEQADAQKKRNVEESAKHAGEQQRAQKLLDLKQRHANFNANLHRAYELMASGEDGLSELRDETRCPPDIRDFTWRMLGGSTELKQWELKDEVPDKLIDASGDQKQGTKPATEESTLKLNVANFSPDGESVAGLLWTYDSHDDAVVVVADVHSGKLKASRALPAEKTRPIGRQTPLIRFSPKSGTIAIANDCMISLWSADLKQRKWQAVIPRRDQGVEAELSLINDPIRLKDQELFQIPCLAFSPSERVLAAVGKMGVPDAAVAVWRIEDGRRLQRIEIGHTSDRIIVEHLAFSRDEKLLAGILSHQELIVWETDGWTSVYQGTLAVRGSPIGFQSLADGFAFLSQYESGLLDHRFLPVVKQKFETDSQFLMTGAQTQSGVSVGILHPPGGGYVPGELQELRFWDTTTGRQLGVTKILQQGLLAVSDDARKIVLKIDRHPTLFDFSPVLIAPKERMRPTSLPDASNVTAIQFSADGKSIATSSYGADLQKPNWKVTLWDRSSLSKRAVLDGNLGVFPSSGEQVAIAIFKPGTNQSSLAWYDAKTGNLIQKGETADVSRLIPSLIGNVDVKDHLVKIGGGWPHLELLDRTSVTGQPARSIALGDEHLWQRPLQNWAVNSAFTRCAVARWRPEQGEPPATGLQVSLFNTENGELLGTIPQKGYIRQVALSADGKLLSVLAYDGMSPRTYSPGDKSLPSLRASVWDAETLQQLSVCDRCPDHFTQMAFSPDGRCLATASSEGHLRLWDPVTGSLRFTLDEPAGQRNEIPAGINAVAFAPDGLSLATAGNFGVKLWTVGKIPRGEKQGTLNSISQRDSPHITPAPQTSTVGNHQYLR